MLGTVDEEQQAAAEGRHPSMNEPIRIGEADLRRCCRSRGFDGDLLEGCVAIPGSGSVEPKSSPGHAKMD